MKCSIMLIKVLTVFLCLFCYASTLTNAQTNTFPSSGNVGIGTPSPQTLLDVGQPLNYGQISSTLARLSEGTPNGSGTSLVTRGYTTQPILGEQYPYIKSFSIEHNFYGHVNNSINFYRGGGFTGGAITFNTDDNSEKMRIMSDGNVGIGTTVPNERLAVNGKIRAKEVIVETTNWPDYVFESNYQLPELGELKKYIIQNHHLPNIISAKEVAEKGIGLGDLNTRLLQKIEELTLYLITKDEQLTQEKQRNDTQCIQIEKLRSDFEDVIKKSKRERHY